MCEVCVAQETIVQIEAELKRLSDNDEKVARWILQERAKLTVGKTLEDYAAETRTPLPVALWMIAQGLKDDGYLRRIALDVGNAQRKKLGLEELPESSDPMIALLRTLK